MSRRFWKRNRDIVDAVDELRPGFWTELADEFRRTREARVTTRGAVVREFPAQEETGIQTVAAMRDAATEPAIERRHEFAVQAYSEDLDPSFEEGELPQWESPWGSPREPASPDWPAPASGPSTPDLEQPEGCWNCGSRAHLAQECPRERHGEFCFRCGTRGYTVPTCPHCREGWIAQGSYVRGRGHKGPEPLRGRRARSGTRPVP